jgi:ABC-type Fe3+ transport system permease subunit
LCSAGGLVALLISRLTIRSARLQSLLPVARPAFVVGYAVVGVAGFFAANAYLDAPDEAGLWGGLFLVFILDDLISRFAFRG